MLPVTRFALGWAVVVSVTAACVTGHGRVQQAAVSVSVADRLTLLNTVWHERAYQMGDSARIEARGLYEFLGHDSTFRQRVDPTVARAIAGDLSETLGRPDTKHTITKRWWVPQQVFVDKNGATTLTARLYIPGPATHDETYRLARFGSVWAVYEVSLSNFIFY